MDNSNETADIAEARHVGGTAQQLGTLPLPLKPDAGQIGLRFREVGHQRYRQGQTVERSEQSIEQFVG